MLTVSDVRERFPEYRDLPVPEVVRWSYQRVGLDLGWSYRETQESLWLALLPPVLLLALSAAVGWVVRGFRSA